MDFPTNVCVTLVAGLAGGKLFEIPQPAKLTAAAGATIFVGCRKPPLNAAGAEAMITRQLQQLHVGRLGSERSLADCALGARRGVHFAAPVPQAMCAPPTGAAAGRVARACGRVESRNESRHATPRRAAALVESEVLFFISTTYSGTNSRKSGRGY